MYKNENEGKVKSKKFYNQEAKHYIKQYREGYKGYPANLIRLNIIVDRLKKNNVKTILDIGCGTCGPMIIRLLQEGFDVKGFDFSFEMVKQGRKELGKAGYKPELIHCADLEDEKTLVHERFDAILALGVFPHIVGEKRALSNVRKLLNKGGVVFIEFRNDLFAAYTLNKYSLDFFLNKLINVSSLPKDVGEEVIRFYSKRLKVDKPVKKQNGTIAYTDVLAKFHNPLNIGEGLFKPCGFRILNTHFYHYHALPPIFENKFPTFFKEQSLQMEQPDDWRGYLMASAYVIEARKIGSHE